MATTYSTTALLVIPNVQPDELSEIRRTRRHVTRETARLIDADPFGDIAEERYINAWLDIATDENINYIADAVEQFTPDEIAQFIVTLFGALPSRSRVSEDTADDLDEMASDLRSLAYTMEDKARRVRKAVSE